MHGCTAGVAGVVDTAAAAAADTAPTTSTAAGQLSSSSSSPSTSSAAPVSPASPSAARSHSSADRLCSSPSPLPPTTSQQRPLPLSLPSALLSAHVGSVPTPSSSSSSPPPPPPPTSLAPPTTTAAPMTSLERWALLRSDAQFNALAGAVGGFTSGVVTCPLDVIKTKLQAQGAFVGQAGHQSHMIYKGLVGTAKVILRDEGVRGLYRGLGPIILGYLPTWAVWFTVYNKSKVWMGERYQNNYVISFWSSLVAGGSSTIVTNPIWVIKTRLMSQMPSHDHDRFAAALLRGANTPTSRPALHMPWHYHSTMDAARKMYTTEGVLSFYSGLTPALLGLTHVAVQFPAYEFFKTKFTGYGMGSAASTDAADGADDADAAPQWIGVLSATILSKVLASGLTYPHEVIRTRLQTQRRPSATAVRAGHAASTTQLATGMSAAGTGDVLPPGAAPSHTTAQPQSQPQLQPPSQSQPQPQPRYRGVITTFRTILHEEGWRAFYAGLGTNMMRAVPAATVTMMTYEYAMRMLTRTRREAQKKLHSTAYGAAS
ncbi:mitochondrial carrier protein [Grosmannia clavigera kw1407]|uniref:Mitochondrial carrier protein n=1 Tax=Grosmannia clavigera (strain kw1407 / UAMH 11150) TaxID=655863 RepID=F0XLK8_GROCL|nr:mitochondrial carrier protein [Grosmannia clavigera kw1407]EFX01094.1 mitochondrial carrier protein [Grosmannia clavigera kw1407]